MSQIFIFDRMSRFNLCEKSLILELQNNSTSFGKKPDKGAKGRLWFRLWDHRSKNEKKRLRSFIPLILYAFAVFYGVIYLSILNTVNRNKTGNTVRSWWGDDLTYAQKQAKQLHEEIERSFKLLRKQVSGGS